MKHKLPNKIKPCSNCPFRKDTLKGWLGAERMKEILEASSFVCHKTLDQVKTLQCAGHMIIKDEENDFVRLANRFNQPTHLTGQELVFDTKEQCINHHK
jgi:hypothetical protein